MIKVLIVEDSRVVSRYLEYILNSDPDIEVIGVANNGKEALELIKKGKPDIITMDIDMPVMGGLEATRNIMSTSAIPILVVTASRNQREVSITMEALASGALSVIEKPVGIGHPDDKENTKKLISMVKVLSEVKVVTRKSKAPKKLFSKTEINTQINNIQAFKSRKIVALGISTGGPNVLQKIFSNISQNFPYPIVVVQHITIGFLEGLVNWLQRLINIPVSIANDREELLPGHIYFAPDSFQLEVVNLRARLVSCDQKPGFLCPSVASLFSSLAKNDAKDTIAMIMTGMGRDGAVELKVLREAGAVTIAQDKASSLIHGMPGEAIKMDAVDYIQNPDEIADLLYEIEKSAMK